jgi:hypothetical protein
MPLSVVDVTNRLNVPLGWAVSIFYSYNNHLGHKWTSLRSRGKANIGLFYFQRLVMWAAGSATFASEGDWLIGLGELNQELGL